MADIDVDALLAAKQGEKPAPKVVRFKGAEFSIPSKLPYHVVEAAGDMGRADQSDVGALQGALDSILKGVLNGQLNKFKKTDPDMDEVLAFVEAVVGSYGVSQGESAPSGG